MPLNSLSMVAFGLCVASFVSFAAGLSKDQCDPYTTAAGLCYSGNPLHVRNSTRGECCGFVSAGDGVLFNYWEENTTCHTIGSYIGTYSCDGGLGYVAPPTPPPPPPPPLRGTVVYHLFEPKFTGLANKDAGDFKGDMGFIFGTFQDFEIGNPEASMEHNIIEMSEVNVTGWGKYEECNAPGAVGAFTCPNGTEYCCTTGLHPPVPTNHTRDQLPGLLASRLSLGWDFGFPGWWFSFPRESQFNTWNERLLRRVAGKCLGNAWRRDSGGCNECGATLDKCVADCIQSKLAINGSTKLLQNTWDRVFSNPEECPDVPLPVSHCNIDDAQSGQRQIIVPGCVGTGCNANGDDSNCAWCVYDMDKCIRFYGDICNETVEARSAQGASCNVPSSFMLV